VLLEIKDFTVSWGVALFRKSLRVSSMDLDTGMRLMQLYQALRASQSPKERDQIKAQIDALVAAAHAEFEAHRMVAGTAHPSTKTDA
jgi:hypothetical protein